MRESVELLTGLLDRDSAFIAWEDFEGQHAAALRDWQRLGFLGESPLEHPNPGCPHCDEGFPYRVGDRLLCNRCASAIDPRCLLAWAVDREAFLRWLAGELRLRGGVRRIDGGLWQLGTWEASESVSECFFVGAGPLTEAGARRLAAYRSAVLVYAAPRQPDAEAARLPTVSILELLRQECALTVANLSSLIGGRSDVRFDRRSGTLWVGDERVGEAPVGSREFAFLDCLASHLDQFVPYADLKRFVLQQTGSRDTTEEATFCQGLKSRIKKKWMPRIDVLIATTNKADGYRLRGHASA
jgi:hypothetical protein